jgi:hypothetical protein
LPKNLVLLLIGEFSVLSLKDRSLWTPRRPSTPVHFHNYDPEPEDRWEHTPKIMTRIKAGPHVVMPCLAKDASIERVIEVLRRRTGITGQWEGRVESEGDAKKEIPRVIELAPIKVTSPQNLPPEITEARVFFETLRTGGKFG